MERDEDAAKRVAWLEQHLRAPDKPRELTGAEWRTGAVQVFAMGVRGLRWLCALVVGSFWIYAFVTLLDQVFGGGQFQWGVFLLGSIASLPYLGLDALAKRLGYPSIFD